MVLCERRVLAFVIFVYYRSFIHWSYYFALQFVVFSLSWYGPKDLLLRQDFEFRPSFSHAGDWGIDHRTLSFLGSYPALEPSRRLGSYTAGFSPWCRAYLSSTLFFFDFSIPPRLQALFYIVPFLIFAALLSAVRRDRLSYYGTP